MRKILHSLLISITILSNVTAQEVSINKIDKLETDTIWLNNLQLECNKDTATFYRVIKIDKTLNYLVNDYYLTGELYMTGTLTSLNPQVREGDFLWYYKGGQKKRMCTYENRIKVNSEYWDIDGNETKPEKDLTEKKPEFPNGESALMKFIFTNLKYPLSVAKNKVQGRVVVKFIVDESGIVRDAEVVKSVHPELDAEALRVVSLMPKWQPGISEGQPASISLTIPFVFRINNRMTNDNSSTIRNNQQTKFLGY